MALTNTTKGIRELAGRVQTTQGDFTLVIEIDAMPSKRYEAMESRGAGRKTVRSEMRPLKPVW